VTTLGRRLTHTLAAANPVARERADLIGHNTAATTAGISEVNGIPRLFVFLVGMR
jgi:hypothetical protein